MIIGSNLKQLLNGKTVLINNISRSIQFYYGDQNEYLRWIADKNNAGLQKYPLIWYVLADYKDLDKSYEVVSNLIIATDTKLEWFNETRNVNTFKAILEPTYEVLKDFLKTNQNIDLLSDLVLTSYPHYSVDTNDLRTSANDFTRTSQKGTLNLGTDLIDAISLKVKFRIKKDLCLI